jgi:hypothetical protein
LTIGIIAVASDVPEAESEVVPKLQVELGSFDEADVLVLGPAPERAEADDVVVHEVVAVAACGTAAASEADVVDGTDVGVGSSRFAEAA